MKDTDIEEWKAPRITVIILTKNEALHIGRAIASVKEFANEVLVVDSGSTDGTLDIARAAGARIETNPWINHATQMNWSIDQVAPGTDWIMRLDADEIVQPDLAREIRDILPGLDREVNGIFVGRRIYFMGEKIRHGGLFPIHILRLFRNGQGHCENRWMDEHIKVEGKTISFKGEIIDDNRKSLSWWIEKHNSYASREVVDLLNLEYGFMPSETIARIGSGQASFKRWLKEKVYARLPSGSRAMLYFFYRYVIRLGFLDGRSGTAFHILQGFWYRYLVDVKMHEVRRYMICNGIPPEIAIRDVLGIDVMPHRTATQKGTPS